LAGQAATLGNRGVRVLVAGPGRAEEAGRLSERYGIPVVADPTGKALDALGCTTVFGPFRRSGSVVLDASGTVRYAVQTPNPNAALPWHEITQALELIAPTQGS
jgi:hypothetical protein